MGWGVGKEGERKEGDFVGLVALSHRSSFS